MAILSKGCKSENFELHNPKSLNQNLVTSLLYVRQTWMNQLILAIFLSVRGYLPFIRKDSTTHMHRPAVYVKEGLCFAQPQDLSLENSVDFNFVFDWRYFTLCLTSFSSITYPLCRYACFFLFYFI